MRFQPFLTSLLRGKDSLQFIRVHMALDAVKAEFFVTGHVQQSGAEFLIFEYFGIVGLVHGNEGEAVMRAKDSEAKIDSKKTSQQAIERACVLTATQIIRRTSLKRKRGQTKILRRIRTDSF